MEDSYRMRFVGFVGYHCLACDRRDFETEADFWEHIKEHMSNIEYEAKAEAVTWSE